PSLLRWDRDLYAVPAIIGATVAALLLGVGALNAVTMTLAATLAFVVRLLAMRYGWRAPRAWHRRSEVEDAEPGS
ncbi:MAG TPA: trimeric intracellular cation channel family protein, partial [Streptomyces sp.]|nr:trimeric intracellular cation channel family protein [Streptomyces sp.]